MFREAEPIEIYIEVATSAEGSRHDIANQAEIAALSYNEAGSGEVTNG